MPRKTEWIERLPAILTSLADFPAPVLDRAAVEILFGVSRRQAVRILNRFGGFQTGRTFLVDRETLRRQLNELSQDPACQIEFARRQKLHARLDQDRRDLAARAIPVKPLAVSSLPSQIQILPGKLTIEFGDTTELLSLLHCLIQDLAQNFDQYRDSTQPRILT